MTRKIFLLIALSFLLKVVDSAKAQIPASIHFDNLGILDGLSQSTVNDILQDDAGFMWFCTDDGVNRFDGYHFKVFRNKQDDAYSLPNSQVRKVYEDSEKNLWFLSANGISLYNSAKEIFDRISYKPGKIKSTLLVHFYETADEIFFSDDGTLYRILKNEKQVIETALPGNDYFIVDQVGDRLLLSGSRGVAGYNTKTHRHEELKIQGLAEHVQASLALNSRFHILIGDSKIFRYDLSTNTCRLLAEFPGMELKGEAVFDAKGLLWLASRRGLICFDTLSLQYKAYTSSFPKRAGGLAGNYIQCLCRDRSDIIWIGTYEGGISKISYSKFKFDGINGSAQSEGDLAAVSVLSFCSDETGNVWMGTDGQGLCIYSSAAPGVSRLKINLGQSRSPHSVFSICTDNGLAWCAYEHGIFVISLQTRRVIAEPLKGNNLFVKKIFRDSTGDLWACTRDSVYQYSTAMKRFAPITLPHSVANIRDCLPDGPYLWIAMDPGLARYDFIHHIYTDYTARYPAGIRGSYSIGSLCKDRSGHLWLSADEKGLLSYDCSTDSFTQYGLKEGLANTSIYATVPDTLGCIWVSTNLGISRFNPLACRFTNYNVSSGLQSSEFNGGASFKDQYGRIWFGGVNGFNFIDPLHIDVNTHPPHPEVTSFRVLEQEIDFRTPLKKGIPVRLHESQNYFTISYSAMDYTIPTDNQYRIMLEGFDTDWRPLSHDHSVSYTNLNGGHYTFKLIAYNNDGVASQEFKMPVYIAPYFYKTWWFRILICILIIGTAISFYRYRIGQLKKEIRLRTSIASDLHDDIGSTLSSIKMLSAMLKPQLKKAAGETYKLAETINLRASSTLEAMSDIVWSINPGNDGGEQLVLRMKAYASELLDESDIDYRFEVSEESSHLKFSQQLRKEIYLIYKEALNNALKYAEAERIIISISQDARHFIMKISDNGRGFDTEADNGTKKGGNGLKNMKQRAKTIHSELNIQSAKENGTSVTLIMPLPHSR